MSVHGELSRHLGALLELAGQESTPAGARLTEALGASQPITNDDLSASARQILNVLTQFDLLPSDTETTPKEFGAETRDAARTVVALCRIVLGE